MEIVCGGQPVAARGRRLHGVVGSSSGRHGLPWWCSGSGPPGTDLSSGLTLPATVHGDDHAGVAFTVVPPTSSLPPDVLLPARPENQVHKKIRNTQEADGLEEHKNMERKNKRESENGVLPMPRRPCTGGTSNARQQNANAAAKHRKNRAAMALWAKTTYDLELEELTGV